MWDLLTHTLFLEIRVWNNYLCKYHINDSKSQRVYEDKSVHLTNCFYRININLACEHEERVQQKEWAEYAA